MRGGLGPDAARFALLRAAHGFDIVASLSGRVAILTYGFPAVSETFVVDHVVGLARRGWTPVVVCDRPHPAGVRDVERRLGSALEVRTLEALRRRPLLGPRRVAELLAALSRSPGALASAHGRAALIRAGALWQALQPARVDLVHAHFGPNGVAAALALRGRLPLVVDFHGADFTVVPRAAGWALYRRALGGASIVAHSDFAARRLREGLSSDVRVVTLGADPSLFQGRARPEAWPSPLRILSVARLVPQKGVDVAVRAVARLRAGPTAIPATLHVVGDGPERGRLDELVRSLSLENVVQLTGALTHEGVAAEMKAADLLVVPSVRGADGAEEAFGRVAVEGLAAGLPVVVSALGGLPEVVGDAGCVVAPGDAGALADAVAGLVARTTPARCAARSAERAKRYTLARMWDEYDAVARRAAAARSRARA